MTGPPRRPGSILSRPSGCGRWPVPARSGRRRWPGCTRCWCGSPGRVRRRGPRLQITGPELDDLAYQAAADAVMAITSKLGQFRGESRFTTWAYKFVIFEVSAKIGRHFWRNPPVPWTPRTGTGCRTGSVSNPRRGRVAGPGRRAAPRGGQRADRRGSGRSSSGSWSTPFPGCAGHRAGLQPQRDLQEMFDARRKLRAALAANGYLDHDTAGRS